MKLSNENEKGLEVKPPKIKQPDTEELKQLVKVYKEVFTVHNIFEKSEDEIFNYLETAEGEILVAIEDDKVVGGLLIVYEEQQPEFKRARFKHVAVAKDYQNKGIGSALLKEAEKIVEKGKIEIHVTQGAAEPVDFYLKNSYKVEGELESHYRPGEKCTIVGKVI